MLYSVTGATGLLGNNLARKLLEAGHHVRVGVRPGSNSRPLEGLDLEVVRGELDDPEFARQLLLDSDGLFHSAGFIWFGSRHREKSMRVNVQASCVLARACAVQNTRMIFVSSTDALAAGSRDRPATEESLEPAKGNSSYVASKRKAERSLLAMQATDHLDIVIVNPGLLVGPWDWKPSTGQMILAVTDGFVPFTPSGGISVADVRRVADAMLVAMQKGRGGSRYILAGENMTYLTLWRKMASLAGRKGPWNRMSAPMERVVGFGGDLVTRIFRRETNVNSAAIQLGANWNYYDSSRAIEELRYDPGSLDEALKDAWQWLVANGYSKRHSPESSDTD